MLYNFSSGVREGLKIKEIYTKSKRYWLTFLMLGVNIYETRKISKLRNYFEFF